MNPKKIVLDGVETQVYLAEITRARTPATRHWAKLPAGSVLPTATGTAHTGLTKARSAGFGVKISASQPEEKGKQAKINYLASMGCTIRLLLADRALTCVTDCFVPPTEVTAVDTKLNKLRLGLGPIIPATISVRRLLDKERIIVNQLQSAADGAEAARKRDAATAELTAKIDTQGVHVNKIFSELRTLTALNVEKSAQLDKCYEHPLSNPEAITEYLLTADSLNIKPTTAVALIWTAHGYTYKKAANETKVSVETIKRAITKMRETPYKKFFCRTKKQKVEARQSIGNDKFAKIISLIQDLSKKDREALEVAFVEKIHPARRVADCHNEPADDPSEE